MPVDARITIEKMLKHCQNAVKYAQCVSFDEFVQNELYLTFTVFSLSQLGELATILSNLTDCCKRYPELPWLAMRSMRNHIVHDYDGLLLTNIWSTVHDDIPVLKEQLAQILQLIDKETQVNEDGAD